MIASNMSSESPASKVLGATAAPALVASLGNPLLSFLPTLAKILLALVLISYFSTLVFTWIYKIRLRRMDPDNLAENNN